jgi:hypothetical protein
LQAVYNPLVPTDFKPDQLQLALLQAALRCLLVQQRDFAYVALQLQRLLQEQRTPKAAEYVQQQMTSKEGYAKPDAWRPAAAAAVADAGCNPPPADYESLLLALVRKLLQRALSGHWHLDQLISVDFTDKKCNPLSFSMQRAVTIAGTSASLTAFCMLLFSLLLKSCCCWLY